MRYFLFALLVFFLTIASAFAFSDGSIFRFNYVFEQNRLLDGEIYMKNNNDTYSMDCTLQMVYLTNPPTNRYTYTVMSYSIPAGGENTTHFTWQYPSHTARIEHYIPQLTCTIGSETESKTSRVVSLPILAGSVMGTIATLISVGNIHPAFSLVTGLGATYLAYESNSPWADALFVGNLIGIILSVASWKKSAS